MTEGRQSGRRTRLGRARSMLLVLLLGAVLTSCETVKSLLETPAVEPVVLELSHQHLRLTPGERFRLHATLRNEAGVKMGGDVLRGTFETIDESCRFVIRDRQGMAHAIAAGDVHFGAIASATAV